MANFDFDAFSSSSWTPVPLAKLSTGVIENVNGWGPTNGSDLVGFTDVPYAHFDKKDRISRCAELNTGDSRNQAYADKKAANYQRRTRDGESNTDFAYKHDTAEDSSFQLVDTAKLQSQQNNMRGGGQNNRGGRGRANWQQQATAGGYGGRGGDGYNVRGLGFGGQTSTAGRGSGGGRGNGGRGGRGNNMRRYQDRKERIASLQVGLDWKLSEEFDLVQLLKLQANPPKGEDLLWAGNLDTYDESYDKATSKTSVPLKRIDNKIFYSVTTMDDPILEKFAIEDCAEIFATDAVLAAIMTAPRSIYSWDIIVQKTDGIIYLDKRDDSGIDLLSVSETAHDPPQAGDGVDEINTPDRLSIEASMINQNFTQQILLSPNGENRRTFEPHPFYNKDDQEEEDQNMEPASVAYRYRKFPMGSFNICVRTELHGMYTRRGTENLLNVFALNEWDSRYSGGINWRQRIDAQRGAVLATELKNNSYKVAKWTAQSILSGADQMKIGYVSRTRAGDTFDHQILATQFFKPKDLATQTNLSITNMWGVCKMFCEMLIGKDDGKYVLLKDPNKATLRLYSVPLSTFEDGDDEEAEAMLEAEN